MLNISQSPQSRDHAVAARVRSEFDQRSFRPHGIVERGVDPNMRGEREDLAPPKRLYETLTADDVANLRRVIFQRRQRYAHFDHELFSDPAWDIILTLAYAEFEQRRVSTSELCAAAEVPVTTGLRWICSMTEKGALIRRPDPFDRRRIFIELTEAMSVSVDQYVKAIRRSY